MKISYFAIFLEGLLSFLSPCVLPLIPVYMAYLSGSKETDEEGNIVYKRKDVFFNTVFFVLGMCLTFTLLAVSVSSIRQYIDDYKDIISLIGGTVIIFFGFHECGLISIPLLDREVSLKDRIRFSGVNIFKAFLFGFLFTFAWSPCIGPMLANALLLAGSEPSGYLYILFYALGLILPFLLTGLFTSSVLNFFKEKKGILNKTLKIAGILLILFGCYMIYNGSRNILAYRNASAGPSETAEEGRANTSVFYDQNGKELSLSEYEGKYVFLNFTASWCTYCRQELPYYIEFAEDHEDVVCLYVMSPLVSREGDHDYIVDYVKNSEMDRFRVIIDEEGLLFRETGVTAFPTLFVVDPEGKYLGYSSGMSDKEGLDAIFEEAVRIYETQE